MSDPTLEHYRARFDGLVCRWCGTPFNDARGLDHYNHTGGVLVAGFEMPQWLSLRCLTCRYDWSLNKLDVLRMHKRRLEEEARLAEELGGDA